MVRDPLLPTIGEPTAHDNKFMVETCSRGGDWRRLSQQIQCCRCFHAASGSPLQGFSLPCAAPLSPFRSDRPIYVLHAASASASAQFASRTLPWVAPTHAEVEARDQCIVAIAVDKRVI